ncbi:MAG: hypothetical protein Q7R71_00750 [bacterium]|nr:hypothetical protein [bacterium]
MQRQAIVALVLILVVAALAVGWQFARPYLPGQTAPAGSYVVAQNSVVITHQKLEQKDVYKGAVTLTSPCATLNASPILNGSNPTHITFMLTSAGGASCAQTGATAPLPFSLTFNFKNASVSPVVDGVTIDGAPVAFSINEQ